MSMFLPLCVVLSYILHSAHSVNVKIYPDIGKEKVFLKLVEGYRFVHYDVPVIPQLSVKDAEMEEGEKGNSEASDAAGMKEDPKSMPLLNGPVLTPVGTKNASSSSARDSATGEAEGPRTLAAFHTLGQTHHIKRPQSVPENCQRNPDFISVGAVKRFTTRKPLYPVVIEYGCGRQAGREYKYVTGTTEAKCDHKGWWTLPALFCAPVGCYLKHWGRAVYAGNVSVTVSGRTCQPWTADTPHVRNRFCRSTSLYYVDGSVSAAGNSCRDPDGTGKPWCYTTDPMKRWEICNIQECTRERECGSPPNIPGATPIQTQVKVHGVDVTYTCRDGMTYMSGEKTISCDMATEQWSEPTLLCYAKRCFYVDYLRNQSIYGGQEDHSASGLQCQSFDRQTPHRHTSNKTEMFPLELSLADVGNQCRDPDGEMTPWCYTVSPKKRWEYCAVPQC